MLVQMLESTLIPLEQQIVAQDSVRPITKRSQTLGNARSSAFRNMDENEAVTV
jgi:hypothetical protein